MDKLKLLLSSRKFWAALVGLVFMILKAWRPDFPLDADQLAGIIAILVTYILGTALEDGLRADQK
jgi:xanthosine utilization system XapX-like protein